MPKSMPQPNFESSQEYFKEYCTDQIEKITNEMVRLDKRLKKLNIAGNLYKERFGEKLILEES